jgi:hypothetical protein
MPFGQVLHPTAWPFGCQWVLTFVLIFSIQAMIADDVCTKTHHHHPSEVGRLPNWIPGTSAALLHNGRLVAKKQDDYVTTAATAPQLHKQLIKKSKRHDPFLAADWQGTTFDDINWKSIRSSFGRLTKG